MLFVVAAVYSSVRRRLLLIAHAPPSSETLHKFGDVHSIHEKMVMLAHDVESRPKSDI